MQNGFETRKLPLNHATAHDVVETGRRRHHMTGLFEVDVTAARDALRQLKKSSGEAPSFTGWIIKCLAQAVSEHPELNSFATRRRMVTFSDVDVVLIVEREVDGRRVPFPYVVRGAQNKSLEEIGAEIRLAQKQSVDPSTLELGNRRFSWAAALYPWIPRWLRLRFWSILMRSPQRAKRMMGTVGVTAVGMFGRVSGWGVSTGLHTLELVVGSVVTKPRWVDGAG